MTDASFAGQVLASDLPVLVDFWAQRCALCLRVAPILEDLAAEYVGRLVVAKLDSDANPETVAAAGVVSIPTLNFYVGGELVRSIVGAQTRPALVAAIEEILA